MLTSHHISSHLPMAIPKAMCLALSCPSDNRKILPVEILMEQQQGILPPLLLCTCSDGRHHIHGNLRRRGCRSSHPRQWFCNALYRDYRAETNSETNRRHQHFALAIDVRRQAACALPAGETNLGSSTCLVFV